MGDDDGIDRLVKAAEKLADSSENNAQQMSALVDRLDRLTFWVAVAAGLSALAIVSMVGLALRQPPPPTVTVQPVIALPTPPSPAVSPTPSPAPSTEQRDPKPPKEHSKKDQAKKDLKKHH